jgi:hypothetical protein
MLNESRYQKASEPQIKYPWAVYLTGRTTKRRSAVVCELPENNFTECHILRAGGGGQKNEFLSLLSSLFVGRWGNVRCGSTTQQQSVQAMAVTCLVCGDWENAEAVHEFYEDYTITLSYLAVR